MDDWTDEWMDEWTIGPNGRRPWHEETAKELDNAKSFRGLSSAKTQVEGLAFVPVVEEDAVPVWGVMTIVMHPKMLDTPGLESDVDFIVEGLGKTVARLRSKEMEAAQKVIETAATVYEDPNAEARGRLVYSFVYSHDKNTYVFARLGAQLR